MLRRRELPTRVTQWLQLVIQRRVIRRVLVSGGGRLELPLPVRLLARVPLLQRLPACLVGIGIRPEHIRSPVAGGAARPLRSTP